MKRCTRFMINVLFVHLHGQIYQAAIEFGFGTNKKAYMCTLEYRTFGLGDRLSKFGQFRLSHDVGLHKTMSLGEHCQVELGLPYMNTLYYNQIFWFFCTITGIAAIGNYFHILDAMEISETNDTMSRQRRVSLRLGSVYSSLEAVFLF